MNLSLKTRILAISLGLSFVTVVTISGCGRNVPTRAGYRAANQSIASAPDDLSGSRNDQLSDEQNLSAGGQSNNSPSGNGSLSSPAQSSDAEEQNPIPTKKPTQPQAPVLLTDGEKRSPIEAFTVPPEVWERIKEVDPKLLPDPVTTFDVSDQHLHIDAINSQVTFSGVLKIKGRADEKFELRCVIDKAQVPWVCDDMLPTDPKLAEQRRFQATFKCLDTYQCDKVGVKLFVAIDGKLQKPKVFQAQGFRIHPATSGDEEIQTDESGAEVADPARGDDQSEGENEDESSQESGNPPTEPPKKDGKKPGKPEKPELTPEPQGPKKLEKPVQPVNPVKPEKAEELTPEEVKKILADPDATVEISTPMKLPTPKKTKNSIPGIEKQYPRIGADVKPQAIGWHTSGSLHRATQMPARGTGFVTRDRNTKDFGTDIMVQLLTGATKAVDKVYPARPPFLICAISKKTGGKLRPHRSHQTGLDVDVAFPSHRATKNMWNVCEPGKTRSCGANATIKAEFDEKRFWQISKQLVCAAKDPVIAMFVDQRIKKHMCSYVRQTLGEKINDPKSCAFKTLRAMRHSRGHFNHFHLRLRCPGNEDCQDAIVTLGSGTGC